MTRVNETEVLEEFRVLVKDLGRSDATLRRVLRARNYNLDNAEYMLRNTIKWREENDVNSALKWKVEPLVVEKFAVEFPGMDNSNRIVFYIPLGAWPISEMVDAGYRASMEQQIFVVMERMIYEIEQTPQDKFTLIVDNADLSYWKLVHYQSVQLILSVFRNFEAHYPERLGECWVVNNPYCANYAWSLIKPLLSGTTMSKVTFLSGGPDKFMPTLLERIPKTSLPTRLRKYVK